MRYCLLFLLALSVFASCTKTETPESKEDMLRAGKWWIESGTKVTHKPYPEKDDTAAMEMPECKNDDRLVFRDGTAGGHTTGGEKCGPELDEYAFTWGLTDNDTKMYLYDVLSFMGQEDVNAKVKEFSGSKFVIVYDSYAYSQDNGFKTDTTTHTITFRKK